MSDAEGITKVAFIMVGLAGFIALGYFLTFVVVPLVLLVIAVDTVMRTSYQSKVKKLDAQGSLDERPEIQNFDARIHDGQIIIAWMTDLPKGSSLDIYRLPHDVAGTASEVIEKGLCVHSTTRDFTNDLSEVFVDHDAPYGVHYYIPVVKGTAVERQIIPYTFLSFYGGVKLRERKKAYSSRGDAVRIDYKAPAQQVELPDGRSDVSKTADEIVAGMLERKRRDSELDEAIAKIRANEELSDSEKHEAIEILETQAEPS
jgi:hypothetical protein